MSPSVIGGLLLICTGAAAILFGRLVLDHLKYRGEESGVPEQPELSEQTCAINAAGLSKENAEVLRRNYQPMSEEDRSELNITFLSIVNPEGVPE
jgi:hypothetical protein